MGQLLERCQPHRCLLQEVDNERDWSTVVAMSTAWLSSPEVDNEWDGPTVVAMSTAWLSTPEVDNERDGPTVGAM